MCSYNRYFQNEPVNGSTSNQINDTEIEEQRQLSGLYDFAPQYYDVNGNLRPGRSIPEFPILRSKLNASYTLQDYQFDHGWLKTGPINVFSALGRLPLNVTIKPFLSWRYGSCATIEPNHKMVGAGGSLYGIVFGIDSKLDYYLESYLGNLEGGVRFQVHPKNVPHDIESLGVSVGAAMQASVDIKKNLIHLQPKPWGQCIENTKKLKYFDTYSVPACMSECFEGRVIDICGCRGGFFRAYDEYPYCDLDQEINCLVRTIGQLLQTPVDETAEDVTGCNCPLPCKFETYDVSVSYGTFPTNAFLNYLETLGKSINVTSSASTSFTNRSYSERNLIMINFYYGELMESIFTESKSVDLSGLFSDIGGQMGLFLGISVVTLFELLQFLFHAIYVKVRSKP